MLKKAVIALIVVWITLIAVTYLAGDLHFTRIIRVTGRKYRVAWIGTYKKVSDDGQCHFVTNTGDEGCYYETESKAKEAVYSAACSDTALGYKVYFESIDTQPDLEPIK